jgi:hypothetical protein
MITTVVLATVLTNSLLATELESTARYDPGKQTIRERPSLMRLFGMKFHMREHTCILMKSSRMTQGKWLMVQ